MTQPKTDWHDAARIAQIARCHINTVRYHWRRAWMQLDLPPVACGFLDNERAGRLIRYIGEMQRSTRGKG